MRASGGAPVLFGGGEDGKLTILRRLQERNSREKGHFSSEAFMGMKDQVQARFEQREAELRSDYEEKLRILRGQGGSCSSESVLQVKEENVQLRDELSKAYQQSYKETNEVVRAFSLLEEEKEKVKEMETNIDNLKEEKKVLEGIVKEKEAEWKEKIEVIAAMNKEMEAKENVITRLGNRLQSAQIEKENAEIASWGLERDIKAKEESAQKVAKEIAIERRTMEFETKRWSDLTNKLMAKLEEQQHSLHEIATKTNGLQLRVDKVTSKVDFLDRSIFSSVPPEMAEFNLSTDDFKELSAPASPAAQQVPLSSSSDSQEKNVVSRFFSSIFFSGEKEEQQAETPEREGGPIKKKRSQSDFILHTPSHFPASSSSSSSSGSSPPSSPVSSPFPSFSPFSSFSSDTPPSLPSDSPPKKRPGSFSGSTQIDITSDRYGESIPSSFYPSSSSSFLGSLTTLPSGCRPTVLSGHTEPVTCVKMCESGHVMVTGASDNLVKVWDVVTGREVRSLEGSTRTVLCVDVSICGRYALGGRKDNAISVWNIKGSRHIDTLTGHTRPVIGAAFDHQTNIISASQDRTLKLWKNTRHEVFQCTESLSFPSIPTDLCLRLSSCFLSHKDHKIREFNLEIGKEADTIDIHSSTVCSVVCPEDPTLLASNARDHTIKICDLRSHTVTTSLRDSRYRVNRDTCRFAMARNMLWAGSETGQIIEWDVRKKGVVRVLEYPLEKGEGRGGGGVTGVGAVHGTGSQLASYYNNRSDCVMWG